MDVKKIIFIIILILIAGVGAVLYFKKDNTNTGDNAATNINDFIKDGKVLDEKWAAETISTMLHDGSIKYDFVSMVNKNGAVAEYKGEVYWKDPNNIKIILKDKNNNLIKELIYNKGVVYYTSNLNNSKFYRFPTTTENGKSVFNGFFDYNFNALIFYISDKTKGGKISAIKDIGFEEINGDKAKIIRYSINNLPIEEKNIQLSISEKKRILLKASMTTQKAADKRSGEAEYTERITITISNYKIENIPIAEFLVPSDAIINPPQNVSQEILKQFIDSDKDGLSDMVEKEFFKTDPNNSDTDRDGYKDGDEIDTGYDPLVPAPKGKLFND